MKKYLLLLFLVSPLWAQTVPADVPYTLTLQQVDVPDMPDLHSFALAEFDGKTILIGGRTNGLHGFPSGRSVKSTPSFPRASANKTIYVVDLAERKVLGYKTVEHLPPELSGQFSASNPQFVTDGPWLYFMGGYGDFPSAQTLITIPQITAIFLPGLIDEVTDPNGKLDADFAKANIAYQASNAAKVTGGELMKLGNLYCLVFGHLFDGEYSTGGAGVQQIYTQAIHTFTLNAWRQNGTVELQAEFLGTNPTNPGEFDADSPYHRRDLNVANAIAPDGTPLIGIYGGVFKGGVFEGFVTPMYADLNMHGPTGVDLWEDRSGTQLLSQYACGLIQVFDGADKAMYSNFFGGISQYYWDPADKRLKREPLDFAKGTDGLPFIGSVSTLKVVEERAGNVTQQFLLPDLFFPPKGAEPICVGEQGAKRTAKYLGTETHFVPAEQIPMFTNGVLNLDIMRRVQSNTGKPIVIGWLIGGIAAVERNGSKNTCASSLVYEVTLDTSKPAKTTLLQLRP